MGTSPYSPSARLAAEPLIRTLVISQHELVRRQLVAYLRLSPYLEVVGDVFDPDTILQNRPDVLVLDLSQLGPCSVRQAIDAVICTGAGLIALASMPDVHIERMVREAGGLYRLKSASAERLAEAVREVAILSKPLATPIVMGRCNPNGASPSL